jgi:ubiquinone/menaquinone biosynthesis C-methylase UbiE
MNDHAPNVDKDVAAGFGHEWSTFRQGEDALSDTDRTAIFDSYFDIFPWDELPPNPVGADIGCGSGRWSAIVARRVGHLHLVDASAAALDVARQNLMGAPNVNFHIASVGEMPLQDNSLDFAFSLGVLHHVPDTAGAIRSIAAKLKTGAPFLIYLYYALDNRPFWYRAVWRASNIARMAVSRLPPAPRLVVSQVIAMLVYWPLARLAKVIEKSGFSAAGLPLEFYRNRSFYVMRTDAYDRFCTRLEQRFTRREIAQMLSEAGFDGIRFSSHTPYWCAVARKG